MPFAIDVLEKVGILATEEKHLLVLLQRSNCNLETAGKVLEIQYADVLTLARGTAQKLGIVLMPSPYATMQRLAALAKEYEDAVRRGDLEPDVGYVKFSSMKPPAVMIINGGRSPEDPQRGGPKTPNEPKRYPARRDGEQWRTIIWAAKLVLLNGGATTITALAVGNKVNEMDDAIPSTSASTYISHSFSKREKQQLKNPNLRSRPAG